MHLKTVILGIFLIILAPFETYAGTATQTEWSGGPGFFGPVINWGDEFYVDTDIKCYSYPSNIVLQKTILEYTVDGNFEWAYSVYSEDVNGDGYMDVLGSAGYDDDITWWENVDGSGTSWTEHTVDWDFDGAWSVSSADIDDDGYMDVLGAGYWADDITWWENVDGSGTSWTEHTVDWDFDGAWSVCFADIDSDGYMDVLGAAFFACDITWWENV
ncbi:MAG: VCBS repeat-containing protein, partial [Candidatus Aegiribacteria sp.]|nr:VCBS repeat-containing protein [Candidatus Aegiribacteria sp.]